MNKGDVSVFTNVGLFLSAECLLNFFQVQKTADCLPSSGIHASKGSQNATFVRSKRHANTTRGRGISYIVQKSLFEEALHHSICLFIKIFCGREFLFFLGGGYSGGDNHCARLTTVQGPVVQSPIKLLLD